MPESKGRHLSLALWESQAKKQENKWRRVSHTSTETIHSPWHPHFHFPHSFISDPMNSRWVTTIGDWERPCVWLLQLPANNISHVRLLRSTKSTMCRVIESARPAIGTLLPSPQCRRITANRNIKQTPILINKKLGKLSSPC